MHDTDGILMLSGTIDGAIDPFIKVLARFEVRDLTVEEPDLEESVLRLYGTPAASAAAPADTAPPTNEPPTRRARRDGEAQR